MRKLNLILITIFIIILAGNAFGQWHPEIDKMKGKVKPKTTAKIKAKKPKGFTEVTGLDIQVERRKKPHRKSAQYNPKEVGIDKIKARKPKSFTSAEGRSMSFELKRKPRKGKRVHKP